MAQDIAADNDRLGATAHATRLRSQHARRLAPGTSAPPPGTVTTAEKLKKAEEVGHFEVATP
jgi:hypothetical protein